MEHEILKDKMARMFAKVSSYTNINVEETGEDFIANTKKGNPNDLSRQIVQRHPQ